MSEIFFEENIPYWRVLTNDEKDKTRKAFNKYAYTVAHEVVEEELLIHLWGPITQAIKDVLTRIESKLTEES